MNPPSSYSFDERCLDLARYFLPDHPEAVMWQLAQDLQDTVEAFEDGRMSGSTENENAS
jgi:hypothetical protein